MGIMLHLWKLFSDMYVQWTFKEEVSFIFYHTTETTYFFVYIVSIVSTYVCIQLRYAKSEAGDYISKKSFLDGRKISFQS